jgi:hypothetical protein
MIELLQPWAILVPAFTAGILLFLSWQAWQRDKASVSGYWGGALGLAVGYAIGHSMIAGKTPAFPPQDAINDWIPYMGLIAMFYGLLEAFWKMPLALRYLLRGVIIGTALWFLLNPLIQGTWSVGVGVGWIVGLGLVWLLFWSGLESLAERSQGASLPIALWILAAGSALVLLFSDSALLGKLSGVVAGMLGAVIVLTFWNHSISLTRGGMAVLTCLLWTLWVDGFAYANLSLGNLGLLALTPMFMWVGQLRVIRELRTWQSFIIQVGLPALLVGLAVLLSYQSYAPVDYL